MTLDIILNKDERLLIILSLIVCFLLSVLIVFFMTRE
jgi:hypothetical protein